jgi:hypothetical protein
MKDPDTRLAILWSITAFLFGAAIIVSVSREHPTITIRTSDFICTRSHQQHEDQVISTGDSTYSVPHVTTVCDQWTRI